MHALHLVPLVLTLTCVVGEFVCLDNATATKPTFTDCRDSDALLQLSPDGGETQVVVCKTLVDIAVVLARSHTWSEGMCAVVSDDDVTDPCPLLYNDDKWGTEILLSVGPIANTEGCDTVCGMTACNRLLEVVNYAKEQFSKKPVVQPLKKNDLIPSADTVPPTTPVPVVQSTTPSTQKVTPTVKPTPKKPIGVQSTASSTQKVTPTGKPTPKKPIGVQSTTPSSQKFTPTDSSRPKKGPTNATPSKVNRAKVITTTTPVTEGETPTTPTPVTEGETPTTPSTEEATPTTPTTEGETPITPSTEGTTPTTHPTIDEEGGVVDDLNGLEEHEEGDEEYKEKGDEEHKEEGDEYDSGDVLLSEQDEDVAVNTMNNQKDQKDETGGTLWQASGNSVDTDFDATAEEYKGHGSGFFFSLFFVAAILCVGGYLFWHNRKKVHDYLTDRRRGRRSKDYRPLLV